VVVDTSVNLTLGILALLTALVTLITAVVVLLAAIAFKVHGDR